VKRTFSISPKRLLVLGALGLTAALTVGYANSNNVPTSNAGDGSGAISGYTVTAVHYTLDNTNPNLTTQVSFNIAPALTGTSSKRVSLDGGTSWIAAGNCSGNGTVICTAALAVTSLTNLRVVAAD
jgi:hypothetical protein